MTLTNRLSDIGVEETDQQTPKHVYFTQVLPVFAVMLAATALSTLWVIESGYVSAIYDFGLFGFIALLGLQLGMIVGAGYFRELYPQNVVFGLVLAVSEGVILAPTVNEYFQSGAGPVIARMILLTSGIFVIMSAVAYVTDYDFSKWFVVLFPALLGMLGLVIIDAFVGITGWAHTAMYAGGVVLFSAFILHDMDEILDGGYGPVSGAISLYLDFLLIFLFLLELTHGKD